MHYWANEERRKKIDLMGCAYWRSDDMHRNFR